MNVRLLWTDGGAVVHLGTRGSSGSWSPLCSFLAVCRMETGSWPMLREDEVSWRQHSGRLVHAAWLDEPVDRPVCATCCRRWEHDDALVRAQIAAHG